MGNAKAVRELEGLQPYPGDGPVSLDKLIISRKWNMQFGGEAAYRQDANFYFRAAHLSPDYGPADHLASDEGGTFSMKALLPHLAQISFTEVDRLEVHVLLFLGRHDYTTPSAIAAAWLDRLSAPKKTGIWLEHSAHFPMLEEPGCVLIALVEHVRPLAVENKSGHSH